MMKTENEQRLNDENCRLRSDIINLKREISQLRQALRDSQRECHEYKEKAKRNNIIAPPPRSLITDE